MRRLCAGLAVVVLLALAAAAAPLVAPWPPSTMDHTAVSAPPSAAHWLGTDDLGRDLLSRVLWGGGETLAAAAAATAIGLGLGVLVGLAAGLRGGPAEAVLVRGVDTLLAFPDLLVALAVLAALGRGLPAVAVAPGFAAAPGYARLVHASVRTARREAHVEAARALGATGWWVATRHVLPSVASALAVHATAGLGLAVGLTAGLSFVGLGPAPPSPEWGAMLDAGVPLLHDAWWVAAVPGAVIAVAVAAVNLLGDGLRDVLAAPSGR